MAGKYRCEAASLTGFIQQVAVSYVRNGYWFYVAGRIPPGKDPRMVDAKFVRIYGLEVSKFVRCRRRKEGLASVQYIRWRRVFLLLSTHGEHLFFQREHACIQDARRHPIKIGGYAISHRNGKVCVRIERDRFRLLRDALVGRALGSKVALEAAFRRLPYEPYAPVRSQLLMLLRAVNRRRRLAGLKALDRACVRLSRRIVKPFL